MSLTQDIDDSNYIITGYQPGCVLINHESYSQSLIICPDKLVTPWEVTHIDQLNKTTLTEVFDLKPEVVLLGTGEQLLLPNPKILALFSDYKIGLETMSTNAACRTYGILTSEGRRTAAAIIFSE